MKAMRATFGVLLLTRTGDKTSSGGNNSDDDSSRNSNSNSNSNNSNSNSNSNDSNSERLEGCVTSSVANEAGAGAAAGAVVAKAVDGGNGRKRDCLLTDQLEVADGILSRKLEGLSEGDLLLIWER